MQPRRWGWKRRRRKWRHCCVKHWSRGCTSPFCWWGHGARARAGAWRQRCGRFGDGERVCLCVMEGGGCHIPHPTTYHRLTSSPPPTASIYEHTGTRPRGGRGRSGRCTWMGRWRARTWRPLRRLRRSSRCVVGGDCGGGGGMGSGALILPDFGLYTHACLHLSLQSQMSKALDTSRKAVGGGGSKGRVGRGARQQLDFIVEGMRSGA